VDMTKSGPQHCGKYYWCIKTDLSEDGEIYVHADSLKVNCNGDLICHGKKVGVINLAIAAGCWKAFFAASVWDGSAIAVEHWSGEVEPRHKKQ